MCSCAHMGVCVCRSTYMSMRAEARGQLQLLLWSCLPLHCFLFFFFFCNQVFHWSGCHQQTPTNPYYLPVSACHIWFFVFLLIDSQDQTQDIRTGEMAQRLRVYTVLPECLSFIPCTLIRQLTTVSNFSCSMGSDVSGLLGHLHLCIYSPTRTHTQNLR